MEVTFITIDEEKKRRPNVTDQDLKAFRDWVDKQPHLPTVSGEDLLHGALSAA